MKPLILFNLKRHFLNSLTVILNIVLFLSCFALVHLDILVPVEIQQDVFYDTSMLPYEQYLKEESLNNHYVYDDERKTGRITVSCKDVFVISADDSIDRKVIDSVHEDLVSIIGRKYADEHPFMIHYIEQLKQIREDITAEKQDGDHLWLVVTVAYFLILNYGNMLCGQLLQEKSSGILQDQLTSVSFRQHFLSKIILGYLVPLIQLLLLTGYLSVSLIVRYLEDRFDGLTPYINKLISDNVPVNEGSVPEALFLSVLIMLAGLLIVQIVMLLLTSGFTSSEQASGFLGIVSIALLAVYYVILTYGKREMLKITAVKVIGLLPPFNMVVTVCRMLCGYGRIMEGAAALVLDILAVRIIIGISIERYRKNLFL